MRLCLVKDGKAVVGDTRAELVEQIAPIKFDYDKFKIGIPKLGIEQDSVGYLKQSVVGSNGYTVEEFRAEAYKRALELLQKAGWVLYRKDGF